MKVEEIELPGALYMEPAIYSDHRGFFFEWFNGKDFENKTGIKFQPVQFNYSKSAQGVLRGLHFQQEPYAQSKVVSVTQGEVQDVIVDIRLGSPTFGKSHSFILNAEKRNQLYIPKGFAHGFLVLSKEAEIFYAIDQYYDPESESGLAFDDPSLDINWKLSKQKIILSDKDKIYKSIKETHINFTFHE